MYCSIFLILIAIIVIFNDLFIAKNVAIRNQTVREEQLKFSRDLHDGVAQDLAAVKLYLEKKDDIKAEFYANQALSEVRYLIDSMHCDFSINLTNVIEEIVSNFEVNFNIKTHLLIISPNLNNIRTEKQTEILRILQECLSNIARHSKATDVTIQFTEVGDDLKFNIKDNGIGLNNEHNLHRFDNKDNSENEKKHYGIKNIEERVADLGGEVIFKDEGGTTIAITIKNFIH